MQPFDYRQQVVNPFEQAIGSALKGFQLGESVRQVREQRQAAVEQQARQQELMRQINALQDNPNVTAEDYIAIANQLPKDQAESLRKNFELLNTERQNSAKRFSGQIAAALLSPNPDSQQRGIDLLRQRAEAERNAGNIEEAEGYEIHARIAETEGGTKIVADEIMTFGSTIFGKDWADGVLKIRETPEAPTRLVTRADRARFAAEGTPLPNVPLQIDGKGKISEVTKGPMVQVAIDQSQRDTLALKELDIPRAKEFSDAAASARKLAQDSRVISNLLKGKGGGAAVKMSTDLARSLGFETETVTANDLVNALATRGAVQIRAPGSGATSDLEFKSYLQAFPSLSNSDSGRQLMAKYADAFAKRAARLADHSRKLIREDRYSEEEIARFDESLGPVLDEDFYNFARSTGPRRPGVSQYPGRETPQRPAAPVPVNPARGGAVFLGFEQ
jgi:hypothetical protein